MKKNILLIGGSYGIGQGIAQLLSKENHVIVASRTADGVPPNCHHLPFDATQDDVSDLDLPESIDGLVYCPGSINLKPFRALKPDAFRRDMEINLIGLVSVVQGILPRIKKAERSSLVFFSTVAVDLGMPFHTSVAAAKGAVEGFARALAAELAPSVRVNVIAPSLTDTPLAGKLLATDEKKEKMAQRNPLKQVGQIEDLASMAQFLIEDTGKWISGQVFHVDGGMSSLKVD
ncbi:SDR family NAD(P)-dependent oxidoreductase [Aureitalea marina]|uniref:Oxidoreductase n=1 Tax=Aureitalea marina TaxID=930804 RepID=A0A2S7KPI6_9FLAO|nr:SDR family oxidoreductase [Aureitalea marina]PQB04532.1 oxidoreductase [Aureitalea marina]